MQHPGRVSFKFIDKMQLVSGSSLEDRGAGDQGWLVHGGMSPGCFGISILECVPLS